MVNEKDIIFIPGNVPSSKNSKVKSSRGVFNSPAVSKYIRSLGIQSFNSRKKTVKGYVDKTRPNQIEALRDDFNRMRGNKGDPIFIGYHQVRKTKHKFDFSNSVELIQDLLTAHDFIEDDNVDFVFPIPMSINGEFPTPNNLRTVEWYSIDKDNPGVYLKIF